MKIEDKLVLEKAFNIHVFDNLPYSRTVDVIDSYMEELDRQIRRQKEENDLQNGMDRQNQIRIPELKMPKMPNIKM